MTSKLLTTPINSCYSCPMLVDAGIVSGSMEYRCRAMQGKLISSRGKDEELNPWWENSGGIIPNWCPLPSPIDEYPPTRGIVQDVGYTS